MVQLLLLSDQRLFDLLYAKDVAYGSADVRKFSMYSTAELLLLYILCTSVYYIAGDCQ